MLKPAICYKDQIESALGEYFYTDSMMFYMGCLNSGLLKIDDHSDGDKYQYAVVDDKGDKLIGYISYAVDWYSSCAYGFGAFSFGHGNPIMGKELFDLLEKLINKMHRVEFRAVSGNPAIRGYDNFLKRHSDIGNKHVFKDEFRDTNGNYHDTYLYEFVN